MRPHICWALKTQTRSAGHFAFGKGYRQAIGVRLIAPRLLCDTIVEPNADGSKGEGQICKGERCVSGLNATRYFLAKLCLLLGKKQADPALHGSVQKIC